MAQSAYTHSLARYMKRRGQIGVLGDAHQYVDRLA